VFSQLFGSGTELRRNKKKNVGDGGKGGQGEEGPARFQTLEFERKDGSVRQSFWFD